MKTAKLLRLMAWVVFVLASIAAIAWWGWLLPIASGAVPMNASEYSQQGLWDAKQTTLNRGFWMHDDGRLVGMYGDKEWAARMIRKLRQGEDYFGCENGHQEEILSTLTNHSVEIAGTKMALEDEKNAWLDWWQENASKTQEEWVRDGFSRAGFPVSLPADQRDWPMLLGILGASAGPGTLPSGRPQPLYSELHYNAYRWLRDSGFEPIRFIVQNALNALDGDIRGGLLTYEKLDQYRHLAPPPGRLSLGYPIDDEYGGMDSRGVQVAVATWDAVGAFISGAALIAACLLVYLRARSVHVAQEEGRSRKETPL